MSELLDTVEFLDTPLQQENICTPEFMIYDRPSTLIDVDMHYCPGCGHSTVHKILAEVVEEMGIVEDLIAVAPVGCSVFAYHYMGWDTQQAAHGRACAVATGIKRVLPHRLVLTYQGDGDLAAIGTAETIHAANRGENILVIFINNGIYGMTSGQMAPTTLEGMVSTTSPFGRDVKTQGYPMKISELIAPLPGVAYITRQAVDTPGNVRKTKKAIAKGFAYQQQGLGFCMIEVVSNCPSNWKMTPVESNKFVQESMIPFYPLGDIKVPEGK